MRLGGFSCEVFAGPPSTHRTGHKVVECLERYTSVARCHELAEASLVLPEALPFVSYVITSVKISVSPISLSII